LRGGPTTPFPAASGWGPSVSPHPAIPAEAGLATLPVKGRDEDKSRSSCSKTRACALVAATHLSVRTLPIFPSLRGDGDPKGASPFGSRPRTRWRLSTRHHPQRSVSARQLRSSSSGKRMLIWAIWRSSGPRFRRESQTFGRRPAPGGGPIVVPGGAPEPPECLVCEPDLVPPHDASRLAPLRERSAIRITAAAEPG
jgi:hypothetical protein